MIPVREHTSTPLTSLASGHLHGQQKHEVSFTVKSRNRPSEGFKSLLFFIVSRSADLTECCSYGRLIPTDLRVVTHTLSKSLVFYLTGATTTKM